ncbi:MAG: hypothetical protein KGI73_01120 [Patescibacteria group bacterium]|nr:hypothetical protein [Patescibacteria group bacterium]
MAGKKHGAEVVNLTPKPSVDSWRTEERNGKPFRIVAQVTVFHRLNKKKQKEAEWVKFTFTLDVKHLKRKSIYHQLELLEVSSGSDLSERQHSQLRRQAKDALDDFYKEYKQEL